MAGPIAAVNTGSGLSLTQQLQAYAVQLANGIGMNPAVFLAQIQQESGWDPNAIGRYPDGTPSGAVGIAQFIPSTAAQYGLSDPTDPWASLEAAAAYMGDLLKKNNGDYTAALTEYNTGSPTGQNLKGADPTYASGILSAAQGITGAVTGIMTGNPGAAIGGAQQVGSTPVGKAAQQGILNALGIPWLEIGAVAVGGVLLLVGVVWLAGEQITASGVASAAVNATPVGDALKVLK